MKEIIDISVALHSKIPIWPGSPGFELKQVMNLEEGDEANVSQLITDIHVGTHVDAPWHFVRGGKTVEQLPLDILIGEVVVADLKDISYITAEDLEKLNLPVGTERLIIHTRNSQLWEDNVKEFQKDFVALTSDAAQWLVDNGIRLVGIDYLSVQRFGDSPLTHEILLGSEVIVIEGLNLSGVQAGTYHLICLPMKILGAEGAPARVVLIRE